MASVLGDVHSRGDCDSARERLAVDEGTQPLTGRPLAIASCGLAILRCEHAVVGRLCTVPGGALAPSRTVILLAGRLASRERDVTCFCDLVSDQRGNIAKARNLVTLLGTFQACTSGLLAAGERRLVIDCPERCGAALLLSVDHLVSETIA
jgi:hypothetical protein